MVADPEHPALTVRAATVADAGAVQLLRKGAWRARYAHPSTGVTQDVLEGELAVLPPTAHDLAVYAGMLAHPPNHGRNLVAGREGTIVGALTYARADIDAAGDIGVFVADGWNGRGVGDALLQRLVGTTDEPLVVEIFARNPSRDFYHRHGFREDGPERLHVFREGVSLPVQRLRLPARPVG